nr:MAG TPA: hypothetical protein [Caudoviricetes sp.]
MDETKELRIPGTEDVLRPGYTVKLGRFDTTVWTVCFGWYSASGNRPCCGWHLTADEGKVTKPLQNTDLADIYVINLCYVTGDDPHRAIEEIDKEVEDIRKGYNDTEYDSAGEAVRHQIKDIRNDMPSFDKITVIQGVLSKKEEEDQI